MRSPTRSFGLLTVAMALLAGLSGRPACAADGDLDPTFGSAGKVMTDLANSTDIANAVALQADRKIVVVGTTYKNNDYTDEDFAVVRYHADGTLDTTFGVNGKVTTDFPGLAAVASSVVIQPDGKILVAGGAFPLFTDFGHIALGVPRNVGLRANDDARFFDLGLCGPLRTDLTGKPDAADANGYCGRFRTPSLRNVALRQVFFHNGAIRSLEEAVRFYATRDTDPRHWYGRDARGRVVRYDDLPSRYHANVNTEPPFGRRAGSPPVLNDAEIGDIVAFLKTLTDADLDAQRPPQR